MIKKLPKKGLIYHKNDKDACREIFEYQNYRIVIEKVGIGYWWEWSIYVRIIQLIDA